MYAIKTAWEKFERGCLKGVTAQQHREAKVAFYAGVASIFEIQNKAATITSASDRVEIIHSWQTEMKEFREAMFPNFLDPNQKPH